MQLELFSYNMPIPNYAWASVSFVFLAKIGDESTKFENI